MSANAIDIDALPGIKRRELTNCALCGKGLAHTNGLMFSRVKVERFVFDARAIQQRAGLEQFLGGGPGGAVLAQAMGTDADLAKCMNSEAKPRLICDQCAFAHPVLLQLAED